MNYETYLKIKTNSAKAPCSKKFARSFFSPCLQALFWNIRLWTGEMTRSAHFGKKSPSKERKRKTRRPRYQPAACRKQIFFSLFLSLPLSLFLFLSFSLFETTLALILGRSLDRYCRTCLRHSSSCVWAIEIIDKCHLRFTSIVALSAQLLSIGSSRYFVNKKREREIV